MNEYVQIVSDQQLEVKLVDTIVLCDRKEEVLFELDSTLAQIVIGVRRSGKSTICHKVLKGKGVSYAYINFDDERLYRLRSDQLNELLEALYIVYGDFQYLFLDEVQNIDEWFLFVNRLLRQKIHLVITGSNAKLLSSELSTHLTGRYNKIELFPFSFAEYCQYLHVDTRDASTKGVAFKKKALKEYLYKGGFPELFSIQNSRSYIQGLLDSIIRRDIQQRFQVRYIETLRVMANHLIDNFGQEIVYQDLAGRFGLKSWHTAENYVSYLKQAYLLLGLHKFSFKSKERIYNEKAYVIDTAFVSERDNAPVSENVGWRLENVVYIELLRRTRPLYLDIYYYKTSTYEVDFVVCRGNHVEELIQVSVDISVQKTYNREVRALLKGARELKCPNLTLITMDDSRTVDEDGMKINIVPASEWLLIE